MNKLYLILLFFIIPLCSLSQHYVKDYTYNASENESKLDAREISLKETKKLLIEELGVYVNTTTTYNNINNNISIETQTKIISECITQTKILEEKWDGDYYYIKVKMYVDKKNLMKRLNKISKKYESYKPTTINKPIELKEKKKIDWKNEDYYMSIFGSYSINDIFIGLSMGIITDNYFSIGLYGESDINFEYKSFGLIFEPLFFNKRKINLSIPLKLGRGYLDERFVVIEPGIDIGLTINKFKMTVGVSYKLITSEDIQNSFCVNLSFKILKYNN